MKNQNFKLFIFCIVSLFGCNRYISMPKIQTTNYQIIDIFYVSKNNFDQTIKYNKETIEINNIYYSVWTDKNGKLVIIYKIVKVN